MSLQTRVIAPVGSGLNRYYPSWSSQEGSFFELDNCYAKRGRIQKRNGARVIGRVPEWLPGDFAVSVINTSTATVTLTCAAVSTGLSLGMRVWLFQDGEIGVFVVTGISAGPSPFTITLRYVPNTPLSPRVGTPNGALQVGLVSVYLPIQGLLGYETDAGNEQTRLIAFTANQAYVFNAGPGTFTPVTGSPTFTSRNYELFNGTMYRGHLYATNFRDEMQRYDGTTMVPFTPTVAGGDTVRSARIIIAYRGRMILFYTYEGDGINPDTPYPQRARWSAPQVDPTNPNAWGDVTPNGATFADAATGQAIVGAAVVRDQLIVYFERSIWSLKYTDNALRPFQWEIVNNQYGAGSTNGVWNFDDSVIGLSQQGFVGSNGADTKRIDLPVLDIPQTIETSYQNQAGAPTGQRQSSNYRRVFMAQDFYNQQMLITYPSEQTSTDYIRSACVRTNRILIWNYLENSWAQGIAYYNSLLLFRTTEELPWSSFTLPWKSYTQPWFTYGGLVDKLILAAGHDSGKLLQISDDISNDVNQFGEPVGLPFSIITNFENPFLSKIQRVRVPYIDIYCVPEFQGTITVNTYVDEANINPEPGGPDPTPSTSQTVPIQGSGLSTVKRVYVNVTGRSVAFQITITPDQATPFFNQDFELQGILVHCCPAGRFTNVDAFPPPTEPQI